MREISHDVERFHQSLRTIESHLSRVHGEKLQSAEEILAMVQEPLQQLQVLSSEGTTKALRATLQEQLDKWQACLVHCEEISRQRSKVQETLQRFSQHLVVAVFGRTNSGKSTFGNFIKGKDLTNAAFPNAYRGENGQDAALGSSGISVLEDAATGEAGEAQGQWFKEGTLETTKEVQVFLMPGVAWLDTPGIGSTTLDYEALARKYAEHTDVLLYLDGSDSPGLRTHVNILRSFLERGCPAWAIINRSDKYQYVKDAEGNYVHREYGSKLKRLCAKSASDRRAQEEQELKALREAGYGEKNDKLNVCSTSVQLAVLATQEADPEVALERWRDSNITAVYDIFASLAEKPEILARFKMAESRRNLRTLMHIIIEGEEAEPAQGTQKMEGLDSIAQQMKKSLAGLTELDRGFNVEEEVASLQKTVLARVQPCINTAVEAAVRTDGREAVDTQSMMQQARGIMRECAHQRAAKLMADIFDRESILHTTQTRTIQAPQLARIKEQREYMVQEVESYARDPEGLWENIRSWTGKEYRCYCTKSVTRTQTIDLGFNATEVCEEMTEQMKAVTEDYLRNELMALKEHCIGAYMCALGEGISAVNGVMARLNEKRKELKD